MRKKTHILIVSFLFSFCYLNAQQEKGIYGNENWLSIWANFNSTETEYKTPTQILSGNITKDTKLLKKETYLLLGNVFVTDSTTLTIEPGTVILGDFKSKGSLTISKTSKIIAEGTQTDPIVFSSNRGKKTKGDWGGIFILGDAPVNFRSDNVFLEYGLNPSSSEAISYGGKNKASSSGIFKYVRIEYAGKRDKNYGYYNGLTLAGVGSGTVLENIMVSYCEGTSFNVIGGNISLSQLVSFRARENDFKLDNGAKVSISNSLAVRSPYFMAAAGASSVLLSSYKIKEAVDLKKQSTHLDATNLTLVVLSDDLEGAIKVGLVHEALHVNEGATFSIQKSVFSGFNPAVVLGSKIKIYNENLNKMEFKNMYFNNCKGNIFMEGVTNNEDLENWYGNSIFQNVYSRGSDAETFIEVENVNDLDFRLRINKIIASNLPDDK